MFAELLKLADDTKAKTPAATTPKVVITESVPVAPPAASEKPKLSAYAAKSATGEPFGIVEGKLKLGEHVKVKPELAGGPGPRSKTKVEIAEERDLGHGVKGRAMLVPEIDWRKRALTPGAGLGIEYGPANLSLIQKGEKMNESTAKLVLKKALGSGFSVRGEGVVDAKDFAPTNYSGAVSLQKEW